MSGSGAAAPLLESERKGEPQKLDGALDVRLRTQKNADPTAFGKDVMRLGSSAGNDLVAQLPWEGDIHQGIPVDVPEFPPADPKLKSAKPVR